MSKSWKGAVRSAAANYAGSTFSEVWDVVRSRPYALLPSHRVTLHSFSGLIHNNLTAAARRTIRNPSDVLPHFRKLIRPNGICLAGQWRITHDSPYTGC